MKNFNNQTQQTQYLAFEKASPEALDSLFKALNAEIDQAQKEKRFPTLDGAFQRLGSFPSTIQYFA